MLPANDQRMDNKIDEKRFVKDALLVGTMEVELGYVAFEKAPELKQPAAKALACRMHSTPAPIPH